MRRGTANLRMPIVKIDINWAHKLLDNPLPKEEKKEYYKHIDEVLKQRITIDEFNEYRTKALDTPKIQKIIKTTQQLVTMKTENPRITKDKLLSRLLSAIVPSGEADTHPFNDPQRKQVPSKKDDFDYQKLTFDERLECELDAIGMGPYDDDNEMGFISKPVVAEAKMSENIDDNNLLSPKKYEPPSIVVSARGKC